MDKARNARAAVGKMLQDVGTLLANVSKSSLLLLGSETLRFPNPNPEKHQKPIVGSFLSVVLLCRWTHGCDGEEVTGQPQDKSGAHLFFLSSDQGGAVDERHLQRLEDSVAGAQRDVDERLRPWLHDMEEQEGAQRRQLSAMNHDIDAILGDIANLDAILATIPNGCFNSPPIEEA